MTNKIFKDVRTNSLRIAPTNFQLDCIYAFGTFSTMNNTSCFCEIFKPYSLLFYPLLLEKKFFTGLLERESTISNNFQ
jgi:hypothetical protein